MAELTELQERLATVVTDGSDADADRILAQLAVLERRRNRLVSSQFDDSPAYTPATSLRDGVIRSLTLLSRPSSIRLIADCSNARWGEPIPTRRLSSLRRDEQASWEANPGGRPTYVVPAITADRFAPVRGTLALSSWPITVRVIASASPRVDLLHSIRNLGGELRHGREADAPWVTAIERLVVRLARTVPGALDVDASGVDLDRIDDACALELEALEPGDSEDRNAAAERALGQLAEASQLFGVRMDVVRGQVAGTGA